MKTLLCTDVNFYSPAFLLFHKLCDAVGKKTVILLARLHPIVQLPLKPLKHCRNFF